MMMRKSIDTIIKQFKNRDLLTIIKKIAEIFYGYPLLLISFLIPRNKNKFLVGSHTPFNDNSKYFLILSEKYNKSKRIIWIAHTRKISEEVTFLGYESYYRWSLRGVYHSLTAKVYVYSFHIIDINVWTSGNTLKFNLFHGIPLKDIEFNVKNGSSVSIYNSKNIISRIFAQYIFIIPDFLLSSQKLKKYFANAFRIKDIGKVKTFGFPRCDLFYFNKEDLLEHISSHEKKIFNLVVNLKKYSKTYIYMPTWRDYDFIEDIGFDFNYLDSVLEKRNEVFLLKFHPATKVDLKNIETLGNIILLKNDVDVYPLLPFTDCLITDYSSIYFDYLLLNDKEVKLFPFDEVKYTKEDRGFIYDYKEVMLSSKYYSFSELIKSLEVKEVSTNSFLYESQIQEYWGEYKGDATKKIMILLQDSTKNKI